MVWDSPDFVSNPGMAVTVKAASGNNSDLTFDDLATNPVYLSAIYDSTGTWDAQSPPLDGSPIGTYGKTPGKPDAVILKHGDTTKIDFTFNDAAKMGSR